MRLLKLILPLLFLLVLSSCAKKYYYYFSLYQYQQNGIRGYIKVNDNLIYPVTSYYTTQTKILPDDAILLAIGSKELQIQIDSIRRYNQQTIKWPYKREK